MKQRALLCATFFCACFAGADGCYIPQSATVKLPEIPGQRALLAWKDGTETLVIASALDSESQKLGWIIPLPSVPDRIEKETPGSLKTLAYCTRPEIVHDLVLVVRRSFALVFVSLLVIGVAVYRPDELIWLIILLVLLGLFGASIFPATSTATAAAQPKACASVESSARVGAYDVTVLRASDAAALNEWLTRNGLRQLPPAADRPVAAYIRDSWVFAAIALTREQAGANVPHPVRLTFKAKEPVYPMRLTALADSQTDLELYVIADRRAASSRLQNTFCDRFLTSAAAPGSSPSEPTPIFTGVRTRQALGHPLLTGLMWNDCVITKLAGTLGPSQMTEDLRFTWKGFWPYRQLFFTSAGATCAVWFIGIWGMGLTLLVTLILCKNRLRQPRGVRWLFGRVLIPASAACALLSWAFLTCAPTLSKSDVVTGYWRGSKYHVPRLQHEIRSALEEDPGLQALSEQELAQTLLDHLLRERREPKREPVRLPPSNLLTGGDLLAEDSPGNFTVENRGGQITVRVYDEAASPHAETYPK